MNTRRLSLLSVLLVLAFGAGFLAAWLLLTPPAPHPTPVAPSPITPSPTPPPTPTATSPEQGDTLETLYLDIAPHDLARIAAKREEALELGILLASDADYVPATIRFRGAEIAVKVRLKGDWIDHFAYEKWSFRVSVRGEGGILGMREFALQDPSTRGFLNEWAYLANLRREGVLVVRYHFLHVVLNGRYMGIYALEESFARELFEAQERREGLILRYSEDLLWEYRAFYDDQTMPPSIERFYLIDEFQAGRIGRDPALAAQRDAAVGLLRGLWTGERSAGEVFDLELMGRFLALSDLWNSEHALIWHNLRYYYNPITARLEPVVFDAQPLPDYLDPNLVGLRQDFHYDPFYHSPELQAAYVRALAEFAQPGYVDELEAELGPEFDALRAALLAEFGEEHLTPPWDELRRRQGLLREMLDPYRTTYAHVRQASDETVEIEVGNLLDLPLEIVGIQVNGALVPARADWAAPESAELLVPPPAAAPQALILRALADEATFLSYVTLRIPRAELGLAEGSDLPALTLITQLWGMSDTHTEPIAPRYPPVLTDGPLPPTPTLEEALALHPFLQPVAGEAMLRVPSGTWEVDGDLILPEGWGLRLEGGTTLLFGTDHFLLARGPLDFAGSADAPIRLAPTGAQWHGVVVLQASAPSTWRYVTVERAAPVDRDGWTLTGGVTFYQSPIHLDHCRILDSPGEDGINVVRTDFTFRDSEFAHAASDAFDADFADGLIERCVFYDTGGDGVDISGSQVQVTSARFLDIGDKGLSVGEASRLTGNDLYFENVGFAVVSKDLSQATVENATVVNARVAGLAAYIKKPTYGPATVSASEVTFIDTPAERQTLVQTGSWIDLNGVRVWGTEVDVEALYQGTGP